MASCEHRGQRTARSRRWTTSAIVIIVGSGPAGYTAAVYAARANLKPLVIEGVTSGGALMTTTEVENFPGFPDGIIGPELMDNMRKQAERFGAELVTDDATRGRPDRRHQGSCVGETEYRARAVILATGSAWRPLGVPGEQELLGHGVSSCATCDGFFFRDQHIAVVGGGDSAMEEATFLTRFAETVTIVHRRDKFRASKIMAAARARQPEDQVRLEQRGRPRSSATAARSAAYGCATPRPARTRELDVTGVFVAIGHDPRSELFRGQVDLDDEGYVLVDAPTHAHQPAPASSPPATWSTTPTGRRSPPPAPAAPPRWTPSATSCRWKTEFSLFVPEGFGEATWVRRP